MLDFAKRKICANQLTNIMKGIAALAPTLLLTLILTSCMSDGYTDTAAGKSDTYINLNVSTPTAQARANAPAGSTAGTSGTLGQDETNPSPDTEEKITSIRVWAFKSGSDKATATPIGFKSETNLSKQGSHNVSMMITRKNAETLGKIDLYILLNAESVGVLESKDCIKMTRAELEALVIKNNFGIDNGTAQTTVVPDAGLPISRVIKDLDVTNNIKDNATEAAQHSINIPLIRAVSKLHFFFTRKKVKDKDKNTEGVEVTKIEVNENVIPTQSSVFPTATTDANKETEGLTGDLTTLSYLNKKMTFGSVATKDIGPVSDPTWYIRKSDQTAEDYITQLRGVTRECHLSYLRETGNNLTGTIYFKLSKNGAEKHKTFSISKAYRNHEMVVYGYFLGDEESTLTLNYYVAGWDVKKDTNITFN